MAHATVTRLAALALAMLATPGLYAQARVVLKLGPQTPHVNEPFVVEVEVLDFEECRQPTFPTIPDCEVRYLGIGRVTRSRSRPYRYELIPLKTGELVIPPVAVKVDGETLATREKRLRVQQSGTQNLFAVEIRCARERIYVGQRVPLTLAIWIKPAKVGRRELTAQEMFRVDLSRSNLGPFPRNIRFTPARRRWTTADGTGEEYYVYEATSDWIADHAGPLAFDDVRIIVQYPTKFGRDWFNGLVVTEQRTLRARPKVSATEVLSPPAEGRPDNFTGAVGSFNIATGAEPTTARVGDPIELTIEIRGDGPLETLRPPQLAANARLTEAFNVPAETLAGEYVRGRRRYTQTIRAKHANVIEIPPIEYAYFDPYSERYEVARSEPIPLRITAAENLDTNELAEPAASDAVIPRTLADTFVGLLGNETSETLLLQTSPAVPIAHVVVATAVPPAVFFSVWGCLAYVQRRGSDVRRQRRAAALRNARKRIDHAQSLPPRERAHEISAALAAYLADRLNEPPARFAGRTGLELLARRRVSPAAQQRWTEAIEQCEQTSYGGADCDADVFADTARDCLNLLERERL